MPFPIDLDPTMTGFVGFGATIHLPININVPVITGTPNPNQMLTCSTGDWIGEPTTYNYIWMSDGNIVTLGADNTYVVRPSDSGNVIYCIVTGTNDAGSAGALASTVPVAQLANVVKG